MTDKVLICDDHSNRVLQWKETVQRQLPEASVETITGSRLADLLLELAAAEQSVRSGQKDERPGELTELAEWADVIIIDSDLTPSPGDLESVDPARRSEVAATLRNGYGDAVARQLRSYTAAKTTVVVNMFWGRHLRGRVFDLTLAQDVRTFADLHISAAELSDPYLWHPSGPPNGEEFRPWQRPSIPLLIETFDRSLQAEFRLDERVLEHFELDPTGLTASQLDPFTTAAAELTFRDLANSRLGFKYPESVDGVAHPDERVHAMSRSVARRWLERQVVPSQTVLIDVPHAIERYWYLYDNNGEQSALNDVVLAEWDSDLGPLSSAVKASVKAFVTRPVFDEEKLRRVAIRGLAERDRPAGSSSMAFAEDVSTILSIDELTQFPTDVAGGFNRRWVKEVEGVGYEPANRLLL